MRLVRRSVLTGADPGCCEGGAEDIVSVYHVASAWRGVDDLALGTHAKRALGVQGGRGREAGDREGRGTSGKVAQTVRSGQDGEGKAGEGRTDEHRGRSYKEDKVN